VQANRALQWRQRLHPLLDSSLLRTQVESEVDKTAKEERRFATDTLYCVPFPFPCRQNSLFVELLYFNAALP
jgi:hypothetical protein